MQLPRSGLAIIGLVSFISFSNASEPATERSDWKKHFDDVSAIGTIIVVDERASSKHTFAYPNGGGAYIVARDNLGEVAAQIAGAALLTDYILTVAVSISSGVAQIVSAFPDLAPYRVVIAVSVIAFMTIVNLRGVRESGAIFAVPTYFFLGMMFITLAVGFYRWATGTLGV